MNGARTIVGRGYTRCRYGQLHYLQGLPDASTPRRPTLILLHQNPSSSMEYEPLLREMCQDRQVIAFDTPGYGMSDRPPAPLSISDYAAAFSDGIDALQLTGPLDAFGFHTGTLLTIELALRRPDSVARVALSGIPMRTPEERAERLSKVRATPGPTEDGAGILATSTALWNFVVTQRDPRLSLDRAVDLYAEKNRTLHRGWWAYDGVWSYDYERLRRLHQPTLIVQPQEPLLEASRAAAALISNSSFVELPGLERDALDLGVAAFAGALRAFFR